MAEQCFASCYRCPVAWHGYPVARAVGDVMRAIEGHEAEQASLVLASLSCLALDARGVAMDGRTINAVVGAVSILMEGGCYQVR